MTSRRKFLQGVTTSGLSAAALAAFPPSIRKALAIPANNRTGTIKDVEHIVILTQENRSFDHYFGTMKGVRGFGDRFTIPQANGRKVWQQLDISSTEVLPYHLDAMQGNAQRVSGTAHSWVDSQIGWLDGRLGLWPAAKSNFSMAYYEQSELPFQFALADAFTVCDDYHCGMHTGTNANRMFLWTGTNGPTGAGVAALNNEWDGVSPADSPSQGYTWSTYPERLQKAGISWIVYEQMPDNYGDNPLVGFRQYRAANQASGKPVGTSDGPYPAYDPAVDDASNPLYKGIANTMPGTLGDVNSYFDRFRQDILEGKLPQVSWVVAPATYSEHPGPSSPVQGAWYIQQVMDALTANPEVWSKTVLLINFDENDGYFDHYPSPAAPSRKPDGTLAGKTTLADADIACEYNDYPSPPGTTNQPKPGGENFDYGEKDGRVFGPGMRVPMYIVSPWSRGGWVNSQAFDHTSVLRFIEARFGVEEPNISPYRRAVLGDLTSAFNFVNPNNEPLPTLAGRVTKEQADAERSAQEALPQIVPPTGRGFPSQATGVRPSRALPYALNVTAEASDDEGTVTLTFTNTGLAAAVFHVYDKLSLDEMPATQQSSDPATALQTVRDQTPMPHRYAVEPGKTLTDVWNAGADNGGRYDLWVLGPNGFHRHFTGDLNALGAKHAPAPEVRVTYDPANGGLRLEASNATDGQVVLTVKSNQIYGTLTAAKASGLAGNEQDAGTGTQWDLRLNGKSTQSLYWNLKPTGSWYDFIITCDAYPGFQRRIAGRMETGRHSVSDPGFGLQDQF